MGTTENTENGLLPAEPPLESWCFDLHRCKHSPIPVKIKVPDIQLMDSSKSLDANLNNKLFNNKQMHYINKGQRRLYLLRRRFVKTLYKLIKRASSVLGCPFNLVEMVGEM